MNNQNMTLSKEIEKITIHYQDLDKLCQITGMKLKLKIDMTTSETIIKNL